MAKKNTSVKLPNSIRTIVRNVQQNGGDASAVEEQSSALVQGESSVEQAAAVQAPAQVEQEQVKAVGEGKDRSAPASKKLPKAEGQELAKKYHDGMDRGDDSWTSFLNLAKEYKMRDSKLATVYMDEDLKRVLDRLKSASGVKLPATALLSSIVARFVFDHEQDIKDAIFGDSLL